MFVKLTFVQDAYRVKGEGHENRESTDLALFCGNQRSFWQEFIEGIFDVDLRQAPDYAGVTNNETRA
jgi:hypothetical protein